MIYLLFYIWLKIKIKLLTNYGILVKFNKNLINE